MVEARAEESFQGAKSDPDREKARKEMMRLVIMQLETAWRIGRLLVELIET